MPIYEYDCLECNETFEELVLSGSDQIKCPKCQTTKVERKMSIFAACAQSADFAPAPGGGGCGGGGGFS